MTGPMRLPRHMEASSRAIAALLTPDLLGLRTSRLIADIVAAKGVSYNVARRAVFIARGVA